MANRADMDASSYQTAHFILRRLDTAKALHYLGQAFVEALPYRPSWSELVTLAGLLAGQDAVAPPAPGQDGAPF